MRTIIIGDIHGCYNELKELIIEADLSKRHDKLIFLGDYVDRGRDSYPVIKYIKSLQEAMGERCIALRGNHDQLMLESMKDPKKKKLWHEKGASETIKSFSGNGKKITSARAWLLSTVLYYETEDYIAAHAGVSELGPAYTDSTMFMYEREQTRTASYSGKLLIHGHIHMDNAIYQPGNGTTVILGGSDTWHVLPACGSICLDTGCVYGNRLTAMVIENGSYCLKSVRSKEVLPAGHRP